MIRTYLDAGVLIAAARGGADAAPALAVLEHGDRCFAASPWLELELLPKPTYLRRISEADFHRAYLHGLVTIRIRDTDEVVARALELAPRFGLSGFDALHVASAIAMQCDELITTELPTRALHRANGAGGLRITALG